LRWEEFHEVSWFGERGGISLFSFNKRRDFGDELIFDELSEGFVVSVSFQLVPTALKDSRDKIKSNLAEVFEEQDVFLSVSRSLTVDFVYFYFLSFIFHFYFSLSFNFNFLFLEQLELGVISHAVTSVTI